MNYKINTLILVIGLSCAFAGKVAELIIEEKCAADPKCQAAAERCIGNSDIEVKMVGSELSLSSRLEAFNKCLNENGQEAKQIKEDECMEDEPSELGKCNIETLKLMETFDESLAKSIRCCYFTGIKSEEVASDGTIVLPYIEKKFSEATNIDEAIAGIYKTAFGSCLPTGKDCNAFEFKKCAVNKCIDKVQEL